MTHLETMTDFFTARVQGYDEHMLQDVEGCKEGYLRMAQLLPHSARKLLDLGCGTGLELDFLFRRFPTLEVTGIDLTQAMLDALREKHPDKHLHLICGDYFSTDFGRESFDCAVSFETMHHFTKEAKLGLYRRIQEALTPDGCYIECDYMVENQEEEDFLFAENRRLRAQQGISDGVFCHFDTPCTVENQIRLLKAAGFRQVKQEFRMGGTTILVACK